MVRVDFRFIPYEFPTAKNIGAYTYEVVFIVLPCIFIPLAGKNAFHAQPVEGQMESPDTGIEVNKAKVCNGFGTK